MKITSKGITGLSEYLEISRPYLHSVLRGKSYNPVILKVAQKIWGLTDAQMRERYPAAIKCKPPVKGPPVKGPMRNDLLCAKLASDPRFAKAFTRALEKLN